MEEQKSNKKRIGKIVYWTIVHGLAAVGLVFIIVFVAIRLKLTDVPGIEDPLSHDFQEQATMEQTLTTNEVRVDQELSDDTSEIDQQIAQLEQTKKVKMNYICSLNELSYTAPKNVKKIMYATHLSGDEAVSLPMIFAVKTHLINKAEVENSIANCVQNFDSNKLTEATLSARIADLDSANIFGWPDKKEWSDVATSITKDKEAINKAAETAKIEPRLLVADLMVEQLRLFYSQRELYKKFFEPLKILANSNKISLGVMAIKDETAAAIESHLKDPNSEYYLGAEMEHVLDYPQESDISSERYKRLTSNDHYYNYLYGALYLKQFLTQWQKAGYPIDKRPEVLSTLFNVGFGQSKPKAEPVVGGSSVTIDQTTYSFGRLAYEFYYSGELLDQFPY